MARSNFCDKFIADLIGLQESFENENIFPLFFDSINAKSSKEMNETIAEELKKVIENHLKVFTGTCPDDSCMTQIFFQSTAEKVTCHKCLQTHSVKVLLNIYEIDDLDDSHDHEVYEFGTDFVKVEGLSNFYCKLLSPFLSKYGMDKLGNPTLLKDLGHTETIDCGKVLGNRSFLISTNQIEIIGYGKDRSGSLDYLASFLDALKHCHNDEERLVPIHVDGDGHCLVHALSRAVSGRELFWHGLRQNLFDHLKKRLSDYQAMFEDFHSKEEWECIIEEADPNCTSSDGLTVGLGNIHIFALSNILKRPIMLLDSLQKMQSRGDYSGLFVPALVEPSECVNKSPICIAWSGAAHNHFVPLVPVQGVPLPTIPSRLIPNLWGVPFEIGRRYLNYNQDGTLTVCSGKAIGIKYLQRLAAAMEKVFVQEHVVAPSLVEDVCRFNYKLNENPGLQPKDLITTTAKAALENRLFRCLKCNSLREVHIDENQLKPGGKLYNLVIECHDRLQSDKLYDFPVYNIKCKYMQATDRLEVLTCVCQFCKRSESRVVDVNSEIKYWNGDNTETHSANNGLKVFWDGKEYDNKPKTFNLKIDHKNEEIEFHVVWFYGESNPDLNSDVQTEAKRIAAKHFGNHVESDNLVNKIVEILNEKCLNLSQEKKKSVEDESQLKQKPEVKSIDKVAMSSAEEGEKSGLNQALHPLAHKRKSNGEPTDPHKHTDQKIVVKISLKGGPTKTFHIDPLLDMSGLQTLIQEEFEVEQEQQILKHGFPPQVLEEPADMGSLGLKSGDKITVEVKMKSLLSLPESRTSAASVPSTQESRRELLVSGLRDSNCSTMWDYAMGKPELFYSGGYFYEKFKCDIGFSDKQHCRFPLLENLAFCYNESYDRVELCLEPVMSHYPIDDDIRFQFKKFVDLNLALNSSNSASGRTSPMQVDPDNCSPKQEAPESSDVSSQTRASNLAPGYHTVGEKPTELTESEKLAQRDSLLKMVEKLKSEHSSS